jgi:hypothetical protein
MRLDRAGIWRRRLDTIRTWLVLLAMCFCIGYLAVWIYNTAPAEAKTITIWGHQIKARI